MNDWIELELLPPWKPIEHYPPPAYRIDELGRCHMRGSTMGGAAGDPIAPMPEGILPADDEPLVSDQGDECRVIDGLLVPTVVLYKWGGGSTL